MCIVSGHLTGDNLILIGVVFFMNKITEIVVIYQKTLDGDDILIRSHESF